MSKAVKPGTTWERRYVMCTRNVLIAALVLTPLVLPTRSAQADTLVPARLEASREKQLTIVGCGGMATATMLLPRGAYAVAATRPRVGTALRDVDTHEGNGRIMSVTVGSGPGGRRAVSVAARGSDAACRTPDGPECVELPDACPETGATEEVTLAADYTVRAKVYVRGTGRGGSVAYKPRRLPFGMRSSVVGLRWRDWGSVRAVGRGSVEFNNCVPNCAEARPSYYAVRVVLSRRRVCGDRVRYRTFEFRYTTARRPPGLGGSYREHFRCD